MTLEERRKAAGLTQAQLAKKLDVGQTAISHWECGRWVPLNKYKRKLAMTRRWPDSGCWKTTIRNM